MLNSIVICVALSAAAQDIAQPEILVTASRAPETADATLATVDVIERAEIDRLQARDALELLRRVAGIELARTGGPGSATSLFMRGTNSNHTLVLIDGVRVASVNTGAYTFEHLPIDLIDRIEIVRGPRAAIWGADALGGVVQVFTRRGSGYAAMLRAASESDFSGSTTLGFGDHHRGANLSVQRRTRDGFSAQLPGSFGYDPDSDGLRQTSLSASAHGELGEDVRVSGQILASDADVEFDQGRSDVGQRSAALTLEHAISANFSQRLALTGARDEIETPVFFQRFDTKRESLDWLGSLHTGVGDWQFGLSALRERGGNFAIGFGDQYRELRRQRGIFGHWRGERAGHSGEIALRHDEVGDFGRETTGQAGWGWRATEAMRVLASVGEGFRAPNFNELYSPGFDGLFAGNPRLEPEHSRALEIGVDLQLGTQQTLRLRAQRNRIRDLIGFTGTNFQARNVRRAQIESFEADWQGQSGVWLWAAAATWQNPVDQDSGETLLRRARRKLSVDLDRPLGDRWNIGGSLYHASERRDFGAELGEYSLLDLRLAYAIGKHWRIESQIANIFDEDYALADGFATPGRNYQLTLRYRHD